MRVAIEPYDPEWPLLFAEKKVQLEHILHGTPIISIEHVGSTAIPSVQAKPVIDIDIIIKPSSLGAARQALSGAGYADCGEMDVPGRFAFRQPGFRKSDAAHGRDSNGSVRYNTYLMIDGCEALKNHLDVRRVLIQDAGLRKEYSEVKQRLKESDFENIGQYAHGKTTILCKILRKAGWSEEQLQPIIKINS